MADIHIEREHSLGLAQARKIAFQWAEQVEEKFDMSCTYEEATPVTKSASPARASAARSR